MGENMQTQESVVKGVYRTVFTVPAEAIDVNGHVNNVRYVQWMQDVAVAHWRSVGGEELNEKLGCTWVARSHRIEYLKPSFEGDEIEGITWIETLSRVRSKRRYAFRRVGEERPLAQGETDWVFIDFQTGHPHAIPREVETFLPVTPEPPL